MILTQYHGADCPTASAGLNADDSKAKISVERHWDSRYYRSQVQTLNNHFSSITGAHSNFFFRGVEGSEDFACATLPTTPLDFQGKIKNFFHPTLLKIRFKITVIPPPPPKEKKMGKVKITVLQ